MVIPPLAAEKFPHWALLNLHDLSLFFPPHFTSESKSRYITDTGCASKWNKLLLKAFLSPSLPSTFLRSLCNLVPGQNKNCRTDHKLRLASRRCFCYNRERWNINIVPANTKCKTIWLRTVSGNISYPHGVCSARMLHLHLKSLNSCIFSLFPFLSSAIRRMQRVGA